MHIREESIEFLKKHPDALGILKAFNPNGKDGNDMGYDRVEDNNGMFLYYRASTKTAVFLYRDVTREVAEQIALSYEHSLFVPYQILIDGGNSPMEYIEEWRKRDEVCSELRIKMNTILYKRELKEDYENWRKEKMGI
jgi:hypothetical protein